jgi:hypothetical protein
VTVPADTKDWTWVLERPCPECGFAAAAIDHDHVAGMIRDNAAKWKPFLEHPLVRARPSDEVWSALEYGCHVRDVFRMYDGRLGRMLAEDDPLYPNWDQNVTAIEERYKEQQPERVAVELDEAAQRLAAAFERVSGHQWRRTGRRSDGAVFTVDTFARYMIHDPIHHIHDVEKGYRALGGEAQEGLGTRRDRP